MLGIGFGELLVILCVGIFFMKPSQFASTFKEIKFFIRKFVGIRNELMNEVLNNDDYNSSNDSNNDKRKIIIKGVDGCYYEAYELDATDQHKYHDIENSHFEKTSEVVNSDLMINHKKPTIILDVGTTNNNI